jgi:molybdopterin adenylyltransferase
MPPVIAREAASSAGLAWKGEWIRLSEADALLWASALLLSRGGSLRIIAAVITVSDKGYAGEREDVSGPVLVEALEAMGAEVAHQLIVPDEPERISQTLQHLADVCAVDLIMTTGGTGATPRDLTPEATLMVIERQMPGLAELLRFEGYKKTPLAVLSRGVAGLRGKCLIVNLPGSPKAVREGMEALAPILPHAIQMAQGQDTEHEQRREGHRHGH